MEPQPTPRSQTTPAYQREYQGSEAQGYDDRRTRDAKWQAEDAALAELLAVAAPAPSTILDIPVGTGRFIPHYVSGNHTVTGADISQDMLDESRAKLATIDGHHISLDVADITNLTYADRSFDVAVCVRLLNLVDADFVTRAVAELSRVSGRLIIGLRTYDTLAAPYQFARRTKDRVTGQVAKVTPHPERMVGQMMAANGLTLDRKIRIDRAARRSSDYHFYLFHVDAPA